MANEEISLSALRYSRIALCYRFNGDFIRVEERGKRGELCKVLARMVGTRKGEREGGREEARRSHRPSSITSLSLFCGALDKNPFRLLKTDRNEAETYNDVRPMEDTLWGPQERSWSGGLAF